MRPSTVIAGRSEYLAESVRIKRDRTEDLPGSANKIACFACSCAFVSPTVVTICSQDIHSSFIGGDKIVCGILTDLQSEITPRCFASFCCRL